jgi:pimeloyl-ACP methyl ester carboxylesterase
MATSTVLIRRHPVPAWYAVALLRCEASRKTLPSVRRCFRVVYWDLRGTGKSCSCRGTLGDRQAQPFV